jgi:hypothetical protein
LVRRLQAVCYFLKTTISNVIHNWVVDSSIDCNG